jgi:hypothetical protein
MLDTGHSGDPLVQAFTWAHSPVAFDITLADWVNVTAKPVYRVITNNEIDPHLPPRCMPKSSTVRVHG